MSRARDPEAIEPAVDPSLEWPPPDPGTTMGRLHVIAEMMTSGIWDRGETAPVLAQAWGLSKTRVENMSAEASRWLKASVDQEQVREQLGYYLSKNLRIADGNPRSVAEVAKAYAPLVGLGDKSGINVYIDARGTLRPDVRALLEACCRAAVASGCDPSEYRERLAGELGATVPRTAIEAVAVPDALAPQERARLLLGELAETWGELDDASELVPVMRVMMGE